MSKTQKWFDDIREAKRAAVAGRFHSFFLVEIIPRKKKGDCEQPKKIKTKIRFYVDLFLPTAIKKRIKAGSAKVEEIFI